MDNDKKYIKKRFLFSAYDLKGVEAFLEEMAEKGLMFVKQNGQKFYFEECEPRKIKFYVDIFNRASVFDTRAEAVTEEYIEYCKASGWEYICTSGKLQYFYTEDEKVTPIQTDEVMRFKWIHKYTMSSVVIPTGILSIMCIMQLIDFVSSNTVVERFIMGWSIPVSFSIALIVAIPQLLRYLYFYIKNKIRLSQGKDIQFFSPQNVKRFHNITMSITIILPIVLCISMGILHTIMGRFALMIIVIIYIGVYGFNKFYDKQKASRRMNRAVTIGLSIGVTYVILMLLILGVVLEDELGGGQQWFTYYDLSKGTYMEHSLYAHEIPITLNMINSEAKYTFEETRAEKYQSLFGTYDTYVSQGYNENMRPTTSMTYEVMQSPFEFIMQAYEEEVKERKYFTVEEGSLEEAALWDAKRVYTIDDGIGLGRMVIYEDWAFMFMADEIAYSKETIETILKHIQ